MPYIVTGDPSNPGNSSADFRNMNFDYDYPEGLDLKPGSKLHQKLRDRIWQRANESRKEMSKRYPSWREIDKTMTVYIPLKEKEKALKENDPTKPVSIVFPYSYSVLESLMTYMSLAFFQDPMFRYEAVEDNDTINSMLMELVIKLHCIKSKVPLAVHTVFSDNFKYGVGVGIPGWTTKHGKVPVRSTSVTESPFGSQSEQSVNFIDAITFEGNNLTNIDPYMWLPDPSCASDKIQDSEYQGWLEQDNYMNMLSAESNPNSTMFNVKYLKALKYKRSALSTDQSERQAKFGGKTNSLGAASMTTNPVDNIKMYINLIPKDWGLGGGEYPEKWFFVLSADEVITEAYRADHNHGMYPIAVASSEYDGYSITPIGRMEILTGLQGTLDFLFNSHITNVRKAVNDMFVVDPYLININDLTKPGAGKIIRMRKPAWGHGVKGAVEQLAVQDITRANIGDSAMITQWMDRISAADQSMQGSLRQGGPERLTKGEFQGTRSSGISRLQRIAMIVGMQFMQDIGTMFAVHTQQYMTTDTFVKITGDNEAQLKAQFGKDTNKVRVGPLDMAIATDLIVRDGSVPGGNFSEAWLQMFKTIGESPELMQEFDITRIFMYIAKQLGAKNVEDFKRNTNRLQPNVMPDDQVAAQAKAGNLIPAGEM